MCDACCYHEPIEGSVYVLLLFASPPPLSGENLGLELLFFVDIVYFYIHSIMCDVFTRVHLLCASWFYIVEFFYVDYTLALACYICLGGQCRSGKSTCYGEGRCGFIGLCVVA